MIRQVAKTVMRQIPAVDRLIRERDDLVHLLALKQKSKFHFVEDYERMVAHLIATMPIDDAMAAAVGGAFLEIGKIECDLLKWAGLRDGMSVIDLGCGSGRLAHILGQRVNVEYLGIDIVQTLLDYAKSKSPPHYKFKLHRELDIPAADHCADFVTAFSVFTHLLHSESYLYLEDIRRVLKPAGRLVFSFLEFSEPSHWKTFSAEVEARRGRVATPVLNTLIERNAIEKWAFHLGYKVECFVGAREAPWRTAPLGQTLAILRL